jgi:hypothetical protein
MTERGLNPEDRELSIMMVKRALACLRVQENKALVRDAFYAGNVSGWEKLR